MVVAYDSRSHMEVGLYTISGGSKPSDKKRGSSRPLDKGEGIRSKKKVFSVLWASVWSKNRGGWGGPLDPPLTIESCKTYLIPTCNIHHSLSKGLSYSVDTHLCHLEAVLL